MSSRSCSPCLSRTAKSKPTKSSTAECHSFQFLIVDDHSLVRNGLRQILASTYPGAGILEASDAKAALESASKKKLDVVLLDISLPGQSGLDVLKQIKELQPHTKILILTMHPEDQYAVRVLKAGASGYLTKNSASEEVAIAIKKFSPVADTLAPPWRKTWPRIFILRLKELFTIVCQIANIKFCA